MQCICIRAGRSCEIRRRPTHGSPTNWLIAFARHRSTRSKLFPGWRTGRFCAVKHYVFKRTNICTRSLKNILEYPSFLERERESRQVRRSGSTVSGNRSSPKKGKKDSAPPVSTKRAVLLLLRLFSRKILMILQMSRVECYVRLVAGTLAGRYELSSALRFFTLIDARIAISTADAIEISELPLLALSYIRITLQ